MVIKKMLFIWWAAIIAMTMVVLTSTFVAADSPSGFIWQTLSLSGENSVGSWWSSILLFMAALHAFDGYLQHQSARPFQAWGWLALGLCCLGLSLDEGGSLHERVGIVSADMGYDWWVLIIPFALVFLVLVAFAIASFMKEKAYLRSALVLLVFGLFALVAVQEEFEHKLQWDDSMLGVRALVEEGTEMFAILLMLWITADNSGGVFNRTGKALFGVVSEFYKPIACAVLVILLPVAYWNASLPDQQRGHPADWFAAVLFFAAALRLLRPMLQGVALSPRLLCAAGVMLAGSCLTFVGHIEYVVDPNTLIPNQQGEGISLRMLTLAGVMILGLLLIHGEHNSISVYYAIAAFIICLCAAVVSSLLMVYLATMLAGLAMYLRSNMVLLPVAPIDLQGFKPSLV